MAPLYATLVTLKVTFAVCNLSISCHYSLLGKYSSYYYSPQSNA